MLFYVTCVRFEFVKSPDVTLCSWRGYNLYKPSINKQTIIVETVQLELTNANRLLQAEKRDLNSFLEKRARDIQHLKGTDARSRVGLSVGKEGRWFLVFVLMPLLACSVLFSFFSFSLHKTVTRLVNRLLEFIPRLPDK